LYIRDLGACRLMPSTINTMMHGVRGFFRLAHIDGLIPAVEREANGMEPLPALLSPVGIPVHAPDHQRCPAVLPRVHHGHPAP
jgi:hypothetical protein